MKIRITPSFILSLTFLIFSLSSTGSFGQNGAAQELAVDNLEKNSQSGEFPSGWKTYPFQKGKAKKVYQVMMDQNRRWVQARDEQDISTPIFRDFHWPLEDYPVLKWQWRAQALPAGAKEDSRATNDSACGIYVAFGKLSGVGLKYVWSSTLPVGHVWAKEPGKFYVIVLASGANQLNQWQSEKINVTQDYKKHFGHDPKKNPSGIGIMTDGNAMHAPAACDYSGFTISKS